MSEDVAHTTLFTAKPGMSTDASPCHSMVSSTTNETRRRCGEPPSATFRVCVYSSKPLYAASALAYAEATAYVANTSLCPKKCLNASPISFAYPRYRIGVSRNGSTTPSFIPHTKADAVE
eukprot:CAMPEP_0119191798 /NCGR_PEP_ID=MMETSP1316-20130426/2492_1 /TAXON_ID=41880 /ORGANISM="Pycnococcus provasolii, Strain RCC2336" /LENGTH=119 /DNA_ID=CAMNT_0007186885 /DNA_START=89 /DNA_END=448 /DNA_ORIENTATION=+